MWADSPIPAEYRLFHIVRDFMFKVGPRGDIVFVLDFACRFGLFSHYSPERLCEAKFNRWDGAPLVPPDSRDCAFHHGPEHVRQAFVAALMEVRQAFVVEAHQVEDCGVEVVEVDFVLHRFEAEVVGFAV